MMRTRLVPSSFEAKFGGGMLGQSGRIPYARRISLCGFLTRLAEEFVEREISSLALSG